MDRSLPGYSVHGIVQARVLEWVAIAFSVQVISYCNFPLWFYTIEQSFKDSNNNNHNWLSIHCIQGTWHKSSFATTILQ